MDGSVERVTGVAGGGGGLKTCPRCGAKLFEDMDVCYGCLYDFNRDAASRLADVDKSLAELVGGLDEPEELATPAKLAISETQASLSATAAEARAGTFVAASIETNPGGQEEVESLEPVAVLSPPARLLVRGEGLEMNVAVPVRGLLVGRASDCDAVIEHPAVSAHHLMLEMGEGGLIAKDLGALNPVLINGWALDGACTLRCGDVIEVRGARVTLLPMPELERGAEQR